MPEYDVRQAVTDDCVSRQRIIDIASQELRLVYKPVSTNKRHTDRPTGVLVATDRTILIGTAEYINQEDRVYIQGVAVHPDYRNKGVCRILIDAIKKFALEQNYKKLSLCVIEETGNARVFEKIGFSVSSKAKSKKYIGANGQSVTQVEMVKLVA